jgi:predicted phosphodiesterase
MLVRLAFLVFASAVTACTEVGEERARDDAAVGHFDGAEVNVHVEEGLAVVRDATAHGVTLWSSAPAWRAAVTVPTQRSFTLEVRNVMPGSNVVVTTRAGDDVALRELAGSGGTRLKVQLESRESALQLALIAPAPEASEGFRFAVLSDVQEAIDDVEQIYAKIAREPGLSFVISAGDLTERGTRDQLERFERELASLPIPFYSTLGNHELGTSPPEYQSYFGRVNVHFHYHDVAFTLADSASAAFARPTLDLLGEWLDEDRERIHVLATHYPLVDPIGVRNGSFASRAEAHHALSLFARANLDLLLHGHIHSYYSYEAAGIPSYIAGGGGAIPERFDDVGRHFLVVEVGKSKVRRVTMVPVD